MKKLAVVISIVLLAVLCVSLSACGITVNAATAKYGEVKSISVTFEIYSNYARLCREQTEIDEIIDYFDDIQVTLRKDLSADDLDYRSNDVRACVSFQTDVEGNDYNVLVYADGTAYLSTKDGVYESQDKLNVEELLKFLRV